MPPPMLIIRDHNTDETTELISLHDRLHPSRYSHIPNGLSDASCQRRKIRRTTPVTHAPEQEPDPEVLSSEEDEGSTGGGSRKWCLCSPTDHPGSFRCRYHQSKYNWPTGPARA